MSCTPHTPSRLQSAGLRRQERNPSDMRTVLPSNDSRSAAYCDCLDVSVTLTYLVVFLAHQIYEVQRSKRITLLSYHCEMYSSPMVRTSEVSLSSVLLVMESPSGEREEREGATGAMSMGSHLQHKFRVSLKVCTYYFR